MLLHLPSAEDTLALGRALGRALAARPEVALLLSGPLGSGKTSLVRGLVEALPGANRAEVASPSFNLMNLYPTTPPVAHFDLYRVVGGAPDELLDLLDDPRTLVAAEWMENIPRSDWPQDALAVDFRPVPSGRALEISAWGKAAAGLLAALTPTLNQWQKDSLT